MRQCDGVRSIVVRERARQQCAAVQQCARHTVCSSVRQCAWQCVVVPRGSACLLFVFNCIFVQIYKVELELS
jgi:hypothetical protein